MRPGQLLAEQKTLGKNCFSEFYLHVPKRTFTAAFSTKPKTIDFFSASEELLEWLPKLDSSCTGEHFGQKHGENKDIVENFLPISRN